MKKGELSGLLVKKYLKNIRDVLLKILVKHDKGLYKEREDDWTLGSGDVVVEIDVVDIDSEEVNANTVKTVGYARTEYAKTVKNIRSNPDTWHRIKGRIEE